ncbi:MAG: iron ABC transporter permease [Deltaproteobacteria bacterium]|jgi:iron complex transport system permease protein|nr:iron ABC transporter permease [Deltaproteobacteria bacterium]
MSLTQSQPRRISLVGGRVDGLVLVAIGLASLVAIIVNLGLGANDIPISEVAHLAWRKILGQEVDPAYRRFEVILFGVRLPRVLLAFLAGSALSLAGAAYQALFRNPMVVPDILGVSSGAGVGASLAIVLGLPTVGLHLMAFTFGLGAVFLVLFIANVVGRGRSLLVLILVGVVVSALFGAVGSFVKYISADDQSLSSMVLWLMGGFSRSSSLDNVKIMALAFFIGAIPLWLTRWRINALAFGEEEAQSMGVNYESLRLIIIVSSTIMTASSVALCGLIGWVGLIIPHLARFLVGPSFSRLLPATILGGGLFMLLVDTVVRVVLPGETPVGIITSILGAPLFIIILCLGRKTWT